MSVGKTKVSQSYDKPKVLYHKNQRGLLSWYAVESVSAHA